jgi:hypothetical protein
MQLITLTNLSAQSSEYKIKVTIPHKYYTQETDLSETIINCLHANLNDKIWCKVLCQTNVNKKLIKSTQIYAIIIFATAHVQELPI